MKIKIIKKIRYHLNDFVVVEKKRKSAALYRPHFYHTT